MLSKITKIINELIKIISIFFISFIWINYYIKKIYLSLLLSIITTFLLLILLNIFLKIKNKKYKINSKEKALIDDIKNQLLFSTIAEKIKFFKILFKYKNLEVENKKNILIYKTKIENFAFFLEYNTNLLQETNLIEILKTANDLNIKKICIFCIDYDKNTNLYINSFKNFDINIFDINFTYLKLFKPLNLFPNFNIVYKENKKLKFKEYVAFAFNKNKTKNYFFSAIIVLLFSFFTKYKIYYILICSLLFIFCIFSRFNKAFNKIEPEFFETIKKV